ncbi:Uma2 family endonuclease [Streptomyces sp. NPDC093252]|uniref:Uma2 family endonuclease n=1 Tax=Streptomyces sp. NPDC093252 TaxID=3154980 RepID=UPI0034260103
MTAEPVQHREPAAKWPVPPQDGYTVDDLFTLKDLPPHTELIDGSLVFVSPQRFFHFLVIELLMKGLGLSLPPDLMLVREMAVRLNDRNAPEPDIAVVDRAALTSLDQSRFEARDVLLAVEVVSPESESRDSTTKPLKYATAGIPHYWRVERDPVTDQPIAHVYQLDTLSRSYVHMGLQRDRIKVAEPYDIDLDLTITKP